MKLLLLIITGIISISSCNENINPRQTPDTTAETPEVDSQGEPLAIDASVANITTSFAFDFFNQVQDEYTASENIFLSPLSLHMALGMVVNGAKGETQKEIIKALHAENIDLKKLNDTYKKLLRDLPAVDPKVQMALANAIFHKNSFPFEAAYLRQMNTDFKAEVKGLSFQPSDVDVINQWASDHTNGKISKVLQTIDPELVMILMNALYFKGDWTTQFDKKNTKDERFTGENNTSKMVEMMKQEAVFNYRETENYQAVNLPYGNQHFRATIILPKDGKTVADVLSNFKTTEWNMLQNTLRGKKVIVSLPKFKLELEKELNKTLQKMGMVKSFTEQADFTTMSKEKPLFVGFVKQNTFVEVNEEGTEAAAVTSVGIGTTSYPGPPKIIHVNCNKPFAFIISEKTSNTILFMGRIMNP